MSLWNLPKPFCSKRHRRHKRVPRQIVSVIEGLEQRTLLSTFTVDGEIKWTDFNDDEHPAPLVLVEVHRRAPDGSDGGILAAGSAKMTGKYSIQVSTGVDTGPTDVFIKVLSRSTVADVKVPDGSETHSLEFFQTRTVADGGKTTINVTVQPTSLFQDREEPAELSVFTAPWC